MTNNTGLTKKRYIKQPLLLFLALFLVKKASAVVYYNQDVQFEKMQEENLDETSLQEGDEDTGEGNSFFLQKEKVLHIRDNSDHREQVPAVGDHQEQIMSLEDGVDIPSLDNEIIFEETDDEDNMLNDSKDSLRHGIISKAEDEGMTVLPLVRFENVSSKRRLYARRNKNDCKGIGAESSWNTVDQEWELVETSYNGRTAYYLSNAGSDRRLYYKNGEVCATKGGLRNDQKWLLDSRRHNGSIAYEIVHAKTKGRLYAEKGQNNRSGFGLTFIKMFDNDQLWFV